MHRRHSPNIMEHRRPSRQTEARELAQVRHPAGAGDEGGNVYGCCFDVCAFEPLGRVVEGFGWVGAGVRAPIVVPGVFRSPVEEPAPLHCVVCT